MFTKLFSSLTTSSIWNEDNDTRILWITLLAMADKTGYVAASLGGLAHEARLSKEACEKSLKILTSKDDDSRSKEFEGKRLAIVDGGFLVLNYAKYRSIRSEEERREYMANYMREYRKQNVNKRKQCKPQLAKAEAEAEAEENSEGEILSKKKAADDFARSLVKVDTSAYYLSEIPQSLNTAEFRALWKDWVSLRRAGKKSRNPDTMFRQQLRDMGEWGLAASLEALKTAIRGDYNGIFPPKNLKSKTQIHLRPAPTP